MEDEQAAEVVPFDPTPGTRPFRRRLIFSASWPFRVHEYQLAVKDFERPLSLGWCCIHCRSVITNVTREGLTHLPYAQAKCPVYGWQVGLVTLIRGFLWGFNCLVPMNVYDRLIPVTIIPRRER